MEVEELIKLISAFGIGTITSVILSFIQSNKRNKLDYIIKERSEWRKTIKTIIVHLLNGNEESSVINTLKTHINPYGYKINSKFSSNYYMKDGHIWDLIDNFDYSSDSVSKLTQYLEYLLKYDWERSKKEIGYRFSEILYKPIRFSVLIFLLTTFFTITLNSKMRLYSLMLVLFFDIFSIFMLLAQGFVEKSWETEAVVPPKKQAFWIIISYTLPYLYTIEKIVFSFSNRWIFDTRLNFLIIIVAIPSAMYSIQKYRLEEEYVAKLKIIDFEILEKTKQSNELKNEINHLKNQINRFDSQISEKDLDTLKTEAANLKLKIKELQGELK